MVIQTDRSMSIGRVLIGLAVLWGIIGLAAQGSWATDSERTRATLRGLEGVQVVIADLGPDVERAGLTRQQLQTDVELQLQQAGVPLVTSAERVHVPGQPFLTGAVHVVPRADGLLAAYAITVEVYQVASLEIEARKAAVSTWSVGTTGSIGIPLLATLRDSVKDAVEHFITAYLSVNPRPVDSIAPAVTSPPGVTSSAKSRNAYRPSASPLEQLTAPWDHRPSKPYAGSRTLRVCRAQGTSTNLLSMRWAYGKLPTCHKDGQGLLYTSGSLS